MSQGGIVTFVGFVAREPNLRPTKDGKSWAELRVGTTPRLRDRATGEWRDGETSYFSVVCFGRLADHVKASMRKGDPVLVKGRIKTYSYVDRTGQARSGFQITADSVGHDLNRGAANYLRPQRPRTDEAGGQALDEAVGQGPDSGPDQAHDRLGAAGGAGIIDEEAIERFGRELDADLDADLDDAALALEEEDAATV
jgi:single-strand DNA-binding protein